MFTVENSAQGNCMYEAYSISLMYFLRSKNNPQITETVFNKFGLTEDEKSVLNSLLTENRDQKFSRDTITDIIEPVLATKARALGARQTREDFINRPRTTGLYASAKYGLEYYFRFTLRDHPESQFLYSDFTDEDYTEAEIFKVANIKTRMLEFARDKSEEVHAQFESEWAKIKDSTESEDVAFRKEMILDQILAEKTVEFFTENDYRNLDAYIARLATNYVWGTEETLLTINRAVQGEHFVRNDRDEVDTYYDTVINLQIRVNGAEPDYKQAEQPDLILNNSSNVHWNSLIPQYIFDPVHQVQIIADEQKARALQDAYDEEKKLIQAEKDAEQQTAFDRQIAEQIAADDLAVADMIKHMLEQDRQLAEQIQAEEIRAKEDLILVTQQDADLTLQISEEEQPHHDQMDPVTQQDADLAQRISDEEQQHNDQIDLLIQQDADLAQRISNEEEPHNDLMDPVPQQDADLALQIFEEEQPHNDQKDPMTQQDADLARRISDEEQEHNDQMDLLIQQDADFALQVAFGDETPAAQDDQVVTIDRTSDNNSSLHDDGQLVNPADPSVQSANQFTVPRSIVANSLPLNNQSIPVTIATNLSYQVANKKFESLLKEFVNKIADLDTRATNAAKARNYTDAASLRKAQNVAQTLLEDLVTAKSDYDARPTQDNYTVFKSKCVESIEKSKPELEHHRGLKQLLGNIVLAVLGLGVVYLAAAAINKAITGNFMFFKTESAKIVDKIKNNVDELAPIQPISVK
ncbi:hypothetical protein [Legionella bononiensis]|uniref:Dot/Icm T4SS effector n=1 Tax=Legionella bononiensis TaxID=2793102 RepID=A0ABS1WEF2_9GAMM|nr:hypothetical protein [Legionella bononiensis]MBL7479399.1 hypothetical protein [Legionella bononiensis]MBL7527728.1 hypothetical protein [Legionella bononiensis]MBL7563589.1 hypothetical protein [Legionella bononiensis]